MCCKPKQNTKLTRRQKLEKLYVEGREKIIEKLDIVKWSYLMDDMAILIKNQKLRNSEFMRDINRS